MTFRLTLHKELGGDEVFPLEKKLTIGRSAENDIHLLDRTVSRRHAVVFVHKGKPYIKDLGSANGTFVNGHLVNRIALHSGDAIRIGGGIFGFLQETGFPKANVDESTPPSCGRRTLGGFLLEMGVLDQELLGKAYEIKKTSSKGIGQILIDMGVANDEEIAHILAIHLKIPLARLESRKIAKEVLSLVNAQIVRKNLLIPLELKEERLLVAMADPLDTNALQDLRFSSGLKIDVAVAPQGEILKTFERYFPMEALEEMLDTEKELEEVDYV
jgi:hypothetical protein